MPTTRPSKKSEAGTPGLKVLITAASLAATLGGWAVLSRQVAPPPTPAPPTAAPTPTPTARVLNLAPSAALVLNLPPLPTLVQPPSEATVPANHTVVANAPVQASVASSNNPPPVQQVVAQPTLRVVDAPPPPPPPPHQSNHSSGSAPAPVTTTKSSKP